MSFRRCRACEARRKHVKREKEDWLRRRCSGYRYALFIASLEKLRLAPTGRSSRRGADYLVERSERIFLASRPCGDFLVRAERESSYFKRSERTFFDFVENSSREARYFFSTLSRDLSSDFVDSLPSDRVRLLFTRVCSRALIRLDRFALFDWIEFGSCLVSTRYLKNLILLLETHVNFSLTEFFLFPSYETIDDLLKLLDKCDQLQRQIFQSFRPGVNNECRISALVPLVEESFGIYTFCKSMLTAIHQRWYSAYLCSDRDVA